MKPFILRVARQLPAEAGPGASHFYDGEKQIWTDKDTGEPIVCQKSADPLQSSRFGETTVTETREGTDRTEITSIWASRFGETTVTKTMEGTDQVEGAYEVRALFAGDCADDDS